MTDDPINLFFDVLIYIIIMWVWKVCLFENILILEIVNESDFRPDQNKSTI